MKIGHMVGSTIIDIDDAIISADGEEVLRVRKSQFDLNFIDCFVAAR